MYRALRQVSRALEALYPLARIAADGEPVLPGRRMIARSVPVSADAATGVHAFRTTRPASVAGSRYMCRRITTPARAYPLVMALHGGAGHGRLFLWSWLREVRGRGVILVAPTAVGDTWSLMEPQVDSAQSWRCAGEGRCSVGAMDRSRLLLTGMSDGGTFTLLSGLDEDSPFTHLAPVAASFHPLLLTMTEPQRVRGSASVSGAWRAGLDVSGVDGAHGTAGADRGGRGADVSRDNRSVACVSARGGERDIGLVPGFPGVLG